MVSNRRYRVLVLFVSVLAGVTVYALNTIPEMQVVMQPLRLFGTLVHEFFHALAAKVTGGEVYELVVHAGSGGYTAYSGGFAPLVIVAGYLGTSISGSVVFYLTNRYQWGAVSLFLLGGMISLFTLHYGANDNTGSPTALFVMLVMLLLMYLFGMKMHWIIGQTAVSTVAVFLAFDGFNALQALGLLSRPDHGNDMEMFSKQFTIFTGNEWSYILAGFTAVVFVLAVYRSLIRPKVAKDS